MLKADEEADRDRHKDLSKSKLTMTECVIAIVLSITFVALLAVFLVEEIEYLVHDRHGKGIPSTETVDQTDRSQFRTTS